MFTAQTGSVKQFLVCLLAIMGVSNNSGCVYCPYWECPTSLDVFTGHNGSVKTVTWVNATGIETQIHIRPNIVDIFLISPSKHGEALLMSTTT